MMKMRKYISAFAIALTTITMVSCTKAVDVNAVSAILPGIAVSSLGMFTTGPYALPTSGTSTIQIIFGATTTNKTAGAFDVFIYDAATPAVAVQTLHFNSWTSNDSFNATSGGSISFTTVPSTYPNTTIYQGSIIVKYTAAAPFVTGHQYNVKIIGYTTDYTVATVLTTSGTQSVTKLIAIQ